MQTKTRYSEIRDTAWSFLLDSGLSTLPLDLLALANSKNWIILPLSKSEKILAILPNKDAVLLQDGFSMQTPSRTIIIYNDALSHERIRFTLAHEFGHIALAHFALAPEEYEKEANMFAARILMPLCLLNHYHIYSAEEIAKKCDVSLEAATFRAERLQKMRAKGKFLTSPLERAVLDKFKIKK